ncbi:NFX1-type zinc finger-containing protein 1, partial [Orchesella cincta]
FEMSSSIPEGLLNFSKWLEDGGYLLSSETVISDVHDGYLEPFRKFIEWLPTVPKWDLESGELMRKIVKLIGALSLSADQVWTTVKEYTKKQGKLLAIACNHKFLEVVIELLQLWNGKVSEYSTEDTFSAISRFCKTVMANLPFLGRNRLESVVETCLDMLNTLKTRYEWVNRLVIEFKCVKEKIKEVNKQAEVEEEASKMREFTEEFELLLHNRVAPDNYRKVQIIPTLVELLENKRPFLRPNKIKGAYQNAEHYLDVQFRLLREDFVQPLRKGVEHLLQNKDEYLKGNCLNKSEENVQIYSGITFSRLDKDDGTHLFRLPYQFVNGVDWSSSKKLMPGCLVVLTSDFFKTAIFATARDDPNISRDRAEGEKPPIKELPSVSLQPQCSSEATFLNPKKNPMSKFIVSGCSTVKLPVYFTDETFLLLPILEEKTVRGSCLERNISVSVSSENQELDPWPSSLIQDNLQLDDDQYEAYKMALTSELAIIQGPPGTGKTFIGLQIVRTLLLNRGRRGSVPESPLLIVCKTNHALDQFLELLLKVHENVKVVRVGSQSNSEEVAQCTLYQRRQELHKNAGKSKKERKVLADERRMRDKVYEIEFQIRQLKKELTALESGPLDRDKVTLVKKAEVERSGSSCQKLDTVEGGQGEADIIGMTTTGAAKHHGVLEYAKPAIVIIEEAAEILEAHVITSLTTDCKQLILIGDHLQLRPIPAVYELECKYRMNVSFFERMILNGVKICTLKTQHRMRPEICDLIAGTVYETLHNHPSVQVYPPVKGIVKSMFFLIHNEPERPEARLMSKSNQHEADFIAGLCEYLLLQEYQPSEITVLTAYNAQVYLLQRVMPASCREVQIVSVDSYQGEENNIILLSLVRSNPENSIGFVGIENRVSTIWQRIHAKLEAGNNCGNGLELKCEHGNVTTVKQGSDFLRLKSSGGCGDGCDGTLDLDEDKENVVSEELDIIVKKNQMCCGHKPRIACWAFGRAKCTIRCTHKLKCGHECALTCHLTQDPDHLLYKCQLGCERQCESGHDCCSHSNHPCCDPCPPCLIEVRKPLEFNPSQFSVQPCFLSQQRG